MVEVVRKILPSKVSIYYEEVSVPMIDPSIKHDLREMATKLSNLRGSL